MNKRDKSPNALADLCPSGETGGAQANACVSGRGSGTEGEGAGERAGALSAHGKPLWHSSRDLKKARERTMCTRELRE